MSVATLHVLHGIQTPSQFYSQVEDATPSPVVDAIMGEAAGFPQPLFRGVRGVRPEITFRTTQLATLLTEAGLTGASLTAGNCDLYYKKCTDLGIREADASLVHTRLRAVDAYLYWRTINARHQGPCTADARICCLYDGTNAPLVAAGTLALAGTPTAAEHFGLGPITLNTVAQDGDVEATIDLGIETIEIGSNSDVYPTFFAVKRIAPVITLRGHGVERWVTYGLVGTALTGLTLYLRRLNPDAAGGIAYYADASAQHLKFTATAGLITIDDSRGGGNDEATLGLRIALRAPTAAGNALTIATAQTIS
jgi:hypothetical protein